MNKSVSTPKGIIIKPEIRFGQPIIEGTRIAVSDVLNLIISGYRIDEIPNQYNNKISLQAAKKAVSYAAKVLGKEATYLIELDQP